MGRVRTDTLKNEVVTAIKNDTITDFPIEFTLSQNYPNPFNSTTPIKYYLPLAGHVKLIVYNLLCQEIKTLINRNHDAGWFSLVWNGRNNSGQMVLLGVYFYWIQAEGFSETKKMLLMQ